MKEIEAKEILIKALGIFTLTDLSPEYEKQKKKDDLMEVLDTNFNEKFKDKENKMTRELTGHKVNPANDKLVVTVMDEPGQGNACHVYNIKGPDLGIVNTTISFQNGPINEEGNGINGLTHEALLAILADRLEGFQSGPYANDYNAQALDHINKAQKALHQRTIDRMNRGVEGTHKV